MERPARILLGLVALSAALLAAYGFFHTFDAVPQQEVWRLGYGASGFILFVTAVLMLLGPEALRRGDRG
jgi:hypothetical protein